MDTTKVGKLGAIILPVALRSEFGIEEGSLVTAEARGDGILIRPAMALPVEIYSPERKAEFLLSNAVDAADHKAAVRQVKKMGLDPRRIDHKPPAGVSRK